MSRCARAAVAAALVVLAATGSVASQTTTDHPFERFSADIPAGEVLGAARLTLPSIDPEILEPQEPVVEVPTGRNHRQSRNAWKKAGSPLADTIAKRAPYAGVSSRFIVDFARNFVGTPYVFSGSTPYGFDCSGYIRFVYAHFGLLLPHGVRYQSESGDRISAKNARPGDLVIWNDRSHAAIYAGGGKILHSPNPGKQVEEIDLYTADVFYVRLPVGTTNDPTR